MDYDFIPRTILSAAELHPDKAAYIYGSETVTYGELSARAMSLAAHLGSGAPVMLYGHRSPVMMIGILACLICGRAYIPCDISLPDERVCSMLRQSGADTVISAEGSLAFDEVKALSVKALSAEDIYALPKRECECTREGCTDAYIIFTSGSTGIPKGIKVSRRSLESFISYALTVYPQEGEIFGGHALFSFDLSVADIFVPLISGRIFHAFDKTPSADAEIITCTPSYLRMCLLSKGFCPDRFPDLKTVLCCGETLPVRTAAAMLERFPGIRLINAYGPAECCCFVSAHEISPQDIGGGNLPIGDPGLTAGEISLINGEIFITGESAANRYIGEHDGGFADGGYYTGDKGEIENGHIYFKGRLNERTVKYSGYRIELGEIEAVLSEAEGISDCCVLAQTDENGTVKLLKALVISERNTDTAEIKKYLARRLPAYMIPKVIERTFSLPANLNGKIQRIGDAP